MVLNFKALEVEYLEAMGGDMVQVYFNEHAEVDWEYSQKTPIPPPIKGVNISAFYEFPPYSKSVEWCDGENYDGGKKISKILLTRSTLELVLEGGHMINVEFETDDITYRNIRAFLVEDGHQE